jgi:ATP phosphoribosyltransferase regulatory subunit
LALLISLLKQVGLKEVRIDLGHASLLKDLLNAAGLDQKQKTAIRSLLACRDSVGLKRFMEQNGFPDGLRDAFLELSACRRLDQVASVKLDGKEYEKVNKQLESLVKLQKALVDYGIDDLVFFDFSLTKQIEYYTGMVFEASVPNLGLPLGSGGRYDNFVEKFGKLKLPATGFAIEIEKLLQALVSQGFEFPNDPKTRVIVVSKSTKTGIDAVNLLRAVDVVASLDVTCRSIEKTLEYATITKADYVVVVEDSLDSPVTVYDLKFDVSEQLEFTSFMRDLRGEN